MDSSHLEDGSQHVFEKGTLSEPATSTSFATKAKKGAGVLLDIFTPELFRRRRCKSSAHRNGPTAWLDGLRGWAAFGVCIMHLTVYTHDNFELCHNHTTDEGEVLNSTPLTLPFIRLPFTGGHFAVMLFFAISGYVVPRRLLSLLHKGNRVDFVESVHSAIIRRPIRLYLPVVLSTLFLWLSWHIFGITTPWPEHQANVFAEFAAWLLDMGRFFYIWRQKALYTIYNIHTWTIPVELRGSLFILVWLFATYRMSTRSRILMTVGMIMYLVLWTAGAMYAIFFAGMLTAELDLLATDGDIAKTTVPWERLNRALGSRRAIRGLAMHVLLVCGLYLAGQPAGDWIGKEEVLGSCPGWQNLAKLIPPAYNDGEASTYRWFWLFWSAWMVLVAIKEIGWVKWIFEASPSQYLGRHSFALYLVHGPMIGILGERLFYLTGVKKAGNEDQELLFGHLQDGWKNAIWWPGSVLDRSEPSGLEPNFWLCVLIMMPTLLYVAEVGTRLFDAPSVRAAKWVYLRMTGK